MHYARRNPFTRGFGNNKFLCFIPLSEPELNFTSQIQGIVRVGAQKKKKLIEVMCVAPGLKTSWQSVFEYGRFQRRDSYAGSSREDMEDFDAYGGLRADILVKHQCRHCDPAAM